MRMILTIRMTILASASPVVYPVKSAIGGAATPQFNRVNPLLQTRSLLYFFAVLLLPLSLSLSAYFTKSERKYLIQPPSILPASWRYSSFCRYCVELMKPLSNDSRKRIFKTSTLALAFNRYASLKFLGWALPKTDNSIASRMFDSIFSPRL